MSVVLEDFWLYGSWGGSGAGTLPIVDFVSQSRTKISRIGGSDSTDVIFTSSKDYQAYQVRVISSNNATVSQGTLLESGTGGTAGANRSITITDAELEAAAGVEGSNLLKIFVQDTSGNWNDGGVPLDTITSLAATDSLDATGVLA